MAPISLIGIVGENPALAAVAREADERLRRVVESLERELVKTQVTIRGALDVD